MNYPIWDVPASGLFIAAIAVLHVFISHFAVGGGLFLVLAERKARREGDDELLDYVRRLSRFFILLTLVLGAITGVGIWFTIGLVHPAATASLINTFVWFWAIEWTFFASEIAAAMVYYYGWDRLAPRTHLRVGWIYFWNAWLSLVVINGILAFMLTPGTWVTTRSVWDGFLNPTYAASVVARTFVAGGLAGLYALAVAGWSMAPALKAKIARFAGLWWVLPMAVAVPLSLAWYLAAARGAGVPVDEILGTSGTGVVGLLQSALGQSMTGQPVTQRAAVACVVSSAIAVVAVIVVATGRRRTFGRPMASLLLIAGLVAIGGAEWTREGLRKPYVIGQVMFVNGVRLPAPAGVPAPPGRHVEAFGEDPFTVGAVNRTGVLQTARWVRLRASDARGDDTISRSAERGEEVFRLLCRACHTVDGYVAIRPLVRGQSVSTLAGTLDRLARPVDTAGRSVGWDHPALRLVTWRSRRMPPFTGTAAERRDLALYLARLGGASPESLRAEAAAADLGRTVYEERCAACHGPESQWPMAERVRGRPPDVFYDLIGRLPQINEMMPPFEGTDGERRVLAGHIAGLGSGATGKEATR